MSRRVLVSCAAVLLTAFLGLAVADNARPWRRLQADYLEIERRELRSRLDIARGAAAARLAELQAQISAEQSLLAERRDETEQLELDRDRFRARLRAATRRHGRVRSELEAARRRAGRPADPGAGEAAAARREELRQARMEVESLRELLADREAKLAAIRADLEAARARWTRERAPIADLERRLAELAQGPLARLAGPFSRGIAVRQVRVADAAGGAAERIDRCPTCHLGVERADAGVSRPPPFRPHPRPELFLGAGSPHPLGRFGCTVCHGGEGRATDFARAGHQPRTAEQEAAWRQDRGWRREALPLRPMLPLDLTEAACAGCHGDEVWTPRAPALDAGRRLIAGLGCTGCHASDHPALADLPKVGPSLLGVAGKTRPAWAYRWLEAGPATSMPHFFPRDEGRGEDARVRLSAEIRAVVHVLWERSRPVAHEAPPPGDREAGKALFDAVGCAACHRVGPAPSGSQTPERGHGPRLARTGSKVSAGWLYAWLRDPRAYRHDTPMPSLRLDENEAADLTAYLMTRRDPAWEGLETPAIDEAVRDALVLSHLEESGTLEASRARLEGLSDRQRNLYLGERTIARHGCHGCHEIAGFETAPPVGPGLAEVRRRPFSASHRPGYRLSDAETLAVNVALLGLTGERLRAGEERTAALAAGRRVMARYGCRGCHRIEGQGAKPRGRSTPPDLAHAGARLKPSWLADYLADPGRVTVRPWLAVRMPSFHLSDAERNALVRYFSTRDDRDLYARDAPRGVDEAATGVAVGRVVFNMLQCGECHDGAGDPAPSPGELAPVYALARERLRRDWVAAWILRPDRWFPETSMPPTFLAGEDGAELDSSFLIGSIDTPIFSVERDRLRRLLGSDEALYAYLSDPERVAAALTDYLWTLGE